MTPEQFARLEFMINAIPAEYGVVWVNKKFWKKKVGNLPKTPPFASLIDPL